MLGIALGGLRTGFMPAVAYTPTVTQLNPVNTFSVNTARYIQIGKNVEVWGRLTINDAGTATGANPVTITLPVTAKLNTDTMGVAKLFDTSATLEYNGQCFQSAVTNFQIMPMDAASFNPSVNNALGALNFVAALATGDVIDYHLTYEAL